MNKNVDDEHLQLTAAISELEGREELPAMDIGRLKILKELLKKNQRLRSIMDHELTGVRFFTVSGQQDQDQQLRDEEESHDDLDLMNAYDDSDDEGKRSSKSLN
jgi:hypothetical protein